MRRTVLIGVMLLLALPANADASCVQSDGQSGWIVSGSGSPDDQCITADEYAEMFSVDNLVDVGVITVIGDNGDGTVQVSYAAGGAATLVADPLERPVAATPALEPDAPTVRQVLYPATAHRLIAMIG